MMEPHQVDSPSSSTIAAPDVQNSDTLDGPTSGEKPNVASSLSSWAKILKNPQQSGEGDPQSGNALMSTFARFTGGLGSRLSSRTADNQASTQPSVVASLTKGLVDSSKNAVKAVQVKARHVVSQNKRRYQEGGFDLDLTYITDNVIAMGFPSGDMSCGFIGYVEGLYRNDMEEVIKFFETRHEARYKVYNLCSERLYDTSLFQGKVASFPFDDHNCPPIHLIQSFCRSASSWLNEDDRNVVSVHCKAGLGRTGLMVSCLLLILKIFPTAEEAISHYNQRRCTDGKGLVFPSQIRYVKYFEKIIRNFNCEIPSVRRCMLKGFRLLNCPYWIRPSITISNHAGILFSTKRHPKTKDLMPQDFWLSSKKKGIMVFALPGEPGLTELAGDFKVYFHDSQGDFYCWLSTSLIENRITLGGPEFDYFEKRKIPAPGFQVEIVMVDYDSSNTKGLGTADKDINKKTVNGTDGDIGKSTDSTNDSKSPDKDDVFSDSDSEGTESSRSKHAGSIGNTEVPSPTEKSESEGSKEGVTRIVSGIQHVSLINEGMEKNNALDLKHEDNIKTPATPGAFKKKGLESTSEFKPVAADASVFAFGDEDEYESE